MIPNKTRYPVPRYNVRSAQRRRTPTDPFAQVLPGDVFARGLGGRDDGDGMLMGVRRRVQEVLCKVETRTGEKRWFREKGSVGKDLAALSVALIGEFQQHTHGVILLMRLDTRIVPDFFPESGWLVNGPFPEIVV